MPPKKRPFVSVPARKSRQPSKKKKAIKYHACHRGCPGCMDNAFKPASYTYLRSGGDCETGKVSCTVPVAPWKRIKQSIDDGCWRFVDDLCYTIGEYGEKMLPTANTEIKCEVERAFWSLSEPGDVMFGHQFRLLFHRRVYLLHHLEEFLNCVKPLVSLIGDYAVPPAIYEMGTCVVYYDQGIQDESLRKYGERLLAVDLALVYCVDMADEGLSYVLHAFSDSLYLNGPLFVYCEMHGIQRVFEISKKDPVHSDGKTFTLHFPYNSMMEIQITVYSPKDYKSNYPAVY